MSRATVRAQIASFLSPSAIGMLSATFEHPPQVTQEGQWYLGQVGVTPENGSGVVMYIHMAVPQQEKLIGINKSFRWRQYTVRLLCFMRSVKQESQAVGADNDTFLDALVARIQSDPNFGTANLAVNLDITPGMIFQAGLGGTDGGWDIRIETDVPRLLSGQQTEIFSTLDFECCENIYTN